MLQAHAAPPKPPEKQTLAEGIEDITIDDAMRTKQNITQKCEEVYQTGKLLGRGGYASVHVGALPSPHVHTNLHTWHLLSVPMLVPCNVVHTCICSQSV